MKKSYQSKRYTCGGGGVSSDAFKLKGRSMLEMLGVLALIGILSVAALAGYRLAMTYYKANETIHDVMLRATNVPMMWDDYATNPNYLNPYEYIFQELKDKNRVGYVVKTLGEPVSSPFIFRVEVTEVPMGVCRRILGLNPTAIDLIQTGATGFNPDRKTPAVQNDCAETGTMYYFFDEFWEEGVLPENPDNPDNPEDPDKCKGLTGNALECCLNKRCCDAPDGVSCHDCQEKLYDGDGCLIGCGADQTIQVATGDCCEGPQIECCPLTDAGCTACKPGKCCGLTGADLNCCLNPDDASCQCNPSCEGCSECIDGACYPIICDETACEVCQDGQCVGPDASACELCQDGQITSKCPMCQKCNNGACEPCGICETCVNGVCQEECPECHICDPILGCILDSSREECVCQDYYPFYMSPPYCKANESTSFPMGNNMCCRGCVGGTAELMKLKNGDTYCCTGKVFQGTSGDLDCCETSVWDSFDEEGNMVSYLIGANVVPVYGYPGYKAGELSACCSGDMYDYDTGALTKPVKKVTGAVTRESYGYWIASCCEGVVSRDESADYKNSDGSLLAEGYSCCPWEKPVLNVVKGSDNTCVKSVCCKEGQDAAFHSDLGLGGCHPLSPICCDFPKVASRSNWDIPFCCNPGEVALNWYGGANTLSTVCCPVEAGWKVCEAPSGFNCCTCCPNPDDPNDECRPNCNPDGEEEKTCGGTARLEGTQCCDTMVNRQGNDYKVCCAHPAVPVQVAGGGAVCR